MRPGTGNRKLIVQAFVSMDGVMQAPGGPDEDKDGGFQHGGWSMAYWDDMMGQIMGKGQAEPHDLLLGRKTYDIFAAYLPKNRDQPGASALNDSTKYVASRAPKKLDWENSYLLNGDIPTAVADLKGQPGPSIHVLGSSNLIQTLTKHDFGRA